MSVGKNTGVTWPWGQGDFDISIKSTQILRESLLARNLDGSYLNRGNLEIGKRLSTSWRGYKHEWYTFKKNTIFNK